MMDSGTTWYEPWTLVHSIHLFTTLFMCGLCWMVQIAHYPLFRAIPIEHFSQYERKNVATAYVTVPIMTIEILTGAWLLFKSPDPFQWSNMLLLGIIWLSTAIFQVPIHLKLMNSASEKLITRVIRTNWIRTISWSLRSLLLLAYMHMAF